MDNNPKLSKLLSSCSWAMNKWLSIPLIDTDYDESQLKFLETLKSECLKYSETFLTLTPPDRHQIVGVEVEVEQATVDWKGPLNLLTDRGWVKPTEDNSLKLEGVEFITKALLAKDLDIVLNALFLGLPENHLFSPRTSIHFHLNVRDFNFGQLLSLIYGYTVVETLLYDWIDLHSPPKVSRRNNIYCVPIQQTEVATRLADVLELSQIPNWAKYTGLNIEPVVTLGTVEFRHLFGTSNRKIIFDWLKIILKLVHWAKTNPYQIAHVSILSLNNNSQYYSFMQEVFGSHLSQELMSTPNVNQKLEKGVSYIKKTMYHNSFFSDLKANYSSSSVLGKRLNKETPSSLSLFDENWATNIGVLNNLNSSETLGEQT